MADGNVRLCIDGRPVSVPAGTRLIEAARAAGVSVPTMCYADGYPHFASCMVCQVLDRAANRFIPSCSAVAEEGMDVDASSDAVCAQRRAALELLLSEHVGDCDAPCRRGCPAHMDIPLMLRAIGAGREEDALRIVLVDIALPRVLGRICPAPCEKACRRDAADGSVAICLLKRFVADRDPLLLPSEIPPPTGHSVGVVGGGPAGLAAAFYVACSGHSCVLYEREEEAGGQLRNDEIAERLEPGVLRTGVERIQAAGVEIRYGQALGRELALAELRKAHDVVVLATGCVAPDAEEYGNLARSPHGLAVDRVTLQTSDPRVFAVGSAVHGPSRLAVRAVADGRTVAFSIDQLLSGEPVVGRRRRFNCTAGRLEPDEVAELLVGANPQARVGVCGEGGFAVADARAEALRCMHCDCRKADDCRLRDYAEEYGARAHAFPKAERPALVRQEAHSGVVYEAGKCIKCGLCVRATERAEEPLGLTFIGRGFETKVAAPLGEALGMGLGKSAGTCVALCPTGALAFRGRDEAEVDA